MKIVHWSPFRDCDEAFDRYLLPRSGVVADNTHDWRPPVNILETDEAYRIDVELPAVDPREVRVAFKDGVLSVTGERHLAKDDRSRLHRAERRYGKFTRSFRLPEDADADTIRATAKDGVIAIAVGKSAKSTARCIEVEVA